MSENAAMKTRCKKMQIQQYRYRMISCVYVENLMSTSRRILPMYACNDCSMAIYELTHQTMNAGLGCTARICSSPDRSTGYGVSQA